MSCMGSFVVAEPPIASVLVGRAGPSPADCQALPDVVVAGPIVRQGQSWDDWLQGLWVLRASASLLVGRAGAQVSDCRALGVLGAGARASVLVWGRAQVLGTQVDRTGWLWVLGS